MESSTFMVVYSHGTQETNTFWLPPFARAHGFNIPFPPPSFASCSTLLFSLPFYARKQNASRVFAIVWASVCLSVRLSVTLVICIKTVQARTTKSSLWAAPRSLVYRDKISCHWVQGFPSNEGLEEGYPLKRRHFAVIGSNNVKTVADRYIHAADHNKHW